VATKRSTPPDGTMSIDLQEIRKIIELMNEHELSYFHLQAKDFNLKLKKGPDLEALRGLAAVAAPVPAAVAGAGSPTGSAAAATEPADGFEITSPMVGTFYRRSSPGVEEFVKVGDAVSEGQTLCIIEAMKVMNEIKADRAGTVVAVLAEDGTPVQYGDPLFRLR
jgi:acetyl-CoA carboxylase biotin carboxyl carrier protein